MCLQGLDQSGEEQSVSKSRSFAGKSDRPARVKTCSTSCGISPASSLAAKTTSPERACASFFQSRSARAFILMVIWYGLEDEPCTLAGSRLPSLIHLVLRLLQRCQLALRRRQVLRADELIDELVGLLHRLERLLSQQARQVGRDPFERAPVGHGLRLFGGCRTLRASPAAC